MVSVGSTAKVDGVDLQKVVNAMPAFVRPSAAQNLSSEAEQRLDISAAGRLKGTAAAVLDAASRLTKAQTWSATKATSSDESAIQAVSNQAKPGDYRIDVDSVAQAQATASATFSSASTVIGIGTLKIELGNWNGSQTAFATNPNWPKANVTFGPKDTSLERVRDKINAAGVGVVASVVSDATGSRLVLRSTSSGADNGFKMEAEGGENASAQDAQALAAMGFDPSKIGNSGAQVVQQAEDAKLRVDGRALQSPQNLVEDEVSGLSLRIKDKPASPVNVRVEPDTDAVRRDVQAFAVTYNELSRQMADLQDAPDGEATRVAREIQSRVKAAFQEADPSGASKAGGMRAVGIQMDEAGQLEVDPARLSRALRKQPEQVSRLFMAPADDDGQAGLAQRLADIRLPDAAEPPLADAQADGQEGAGVSQDQQAAASQDDAARNAAGARFRQKLLEQYAAAENSELAIQANEA